MIIKNLKFINSEISLGMRILLPVLLFSTVFSCSANYAAVNNRENFTSANFARKNRVPESVVINIIPHKKNCLFDANHPVRYDVEVINNYKASQEGKIAVEVKAATGETIGLSEIDVNIRGNRKRKFEWNIPVNDPGFYDIIVKINLSDYDDTVRNVFGYKPYEISTPVHKPADFDAYWQKAKDDLAAVDPKYNIIEDDTLSTPTHKVYRVEMYSLDNVKIYGWLTVPRPMGKYPVLYGLGGYLIELKPIFFDDFVGFTIDPRGIGESYNVIDPNKDDVLTLHLEDKNKYVYRGIYMDCMRGLDFILSHADMKMDISRIGAFGGSQGGTLTWIVAAMSKKITFCITDNPIFCDFRANYAICNYRPDPSFIIRMLKDFFKKNNTIPKERFFGTLSYFEAQNFTPDIQCPVLLGGGLLDLMAPPTCTFSAYNRMSVAVKKKSEVYMFPYLAHEVTKRHNTYKSTWFYEKTVFALGHQLNPKN